MAVNSLTGCADHNGFRFLPKILSVPAFSWSGMYNNEIRIKTKHTFLVLLFDSKLTFGPHTWKLEMECCKSLHIMTVLSLKSWGADRFCLMRVCHCSIIRSRLNCGHIVYGSARASTLKTLYSLQYLELRLATKVFHALPVTSLYADLINGHQNNGECFHL